MKERVIVLELIEEESIRNFGRLELANAAGTAKSCGFTAEILSDTADRVDVEQLIREVPAFIICLLYHSNVSVTERILKSMKRKLGDMVCIGIGSYASLYYEDILMNCDSIDFIVRGEAERPLEQLFRKYNAKKALKDTAGISYKQEGTVRSNIESEPVEHLDLLPMPAYELLDKREAAGYLSTSRGCMGNCSFCMHKRLQKGWRGKTPKRVIKEIEALLKTQEERLITITDCSFEDPDASGLRIRDICREIIESGLTFSYVTSFRAGFYKKADDELKDTLVKSGLAAALIGIESGNAADLKLYHKSATVTDNRNILTFFRELDVVTIPSFINFNPYTTLGGLTENLEFLHQFEQCIRFFSYLDVFEQAPIFERIREDGLLCEEAAESGHSNNYDMRARSVRTYRYQIGEIGELADYLKHILEKLNEEGKHIFDDILFLYEKNLIQFKVMYAEEENEQIKKIIRDYREGFWVRNQLFDRKVYAFLKQLLSILEAGWSVKKAKECFRERNMEEVFLNYRNQEVTVRMQSIKNMLRKKRERG